MTEENPDAVFLNPEYLEKLNQVPEVNDDEFREFILTHNHDIPLELKKSVDEYMSNPLNQSDSKILGWIKDWIEHPERSKIYRDQVLFRIHQHHPHPEDYMDDGKEWKFEIPIFSMEF